MITLIALLLAVTGLIGIGFGVRALISNIRSSNPDGNKRSSRKTFVAVLIIGILAGVATWPATYAMGYPVATESGNGRIVGIPFFAAYFDAKGYDYVGPTTMPAIFANGIFWFFIPQIILFLLWRRNPSRMVNITEYAEHAPPEGRRETRRS